MSRRNILFPYSTQTASWRRRQHPPSTDHINWRVHPVSQLRRIHSKKTTDKKYSDFYLVHMPSLLLISEKILKIFSQNVYTNSTAYSVERTVCSSLILTTLSPVVGLRNSVATVEWMILPCFKSCCGLLQKFIDFYVMLWHLINCKDYHYWMNL
jgi:hypothetical protein